MSVLKFGKFKGQEIEAVASTKQGRSWLAWWVEQPCADEKYKHANDALKAEIRMILSQVPDIYPAEKPANNIPFRPAQTIEKAVASDQISAMGLAQIFRHIGDYFFQASSILTQTAPKDDKEWE